MASVEPQRDVVFTLSQESLDDVLAREWCRPPDQTLLALARDPRVGRLLSADPWRSLPISVARRRATSRTSELVVAGRPITRVRPMRVRRADPVRVDEVKQSYARYGLQLGTALRRQAGPSARASLVTYHPFVAAWCRPDWVTHTVYVGRDDWMSFGRYSAWRSIYEQAYRDMQRPDVAGFAVSEELSRRLSPEGRVTVVPNGVDVERWAARRPEPILLTRLPRPVAVYVGTVDDRLDWELVQATADGVGTLVLLGPVEDPGMERLLRTDARIQSLGRVLQDDLVAFVQHADVGVIPHADTALTRAMSPLKLYEYLAGGLPILSRDLPPVRGVHPSVRLADQTSWRRELGAVLATGRMPEAARLEVLGSLSWASRQAPVVQAAVTGGRGLA